MSVRQTLLKQRAGMAILPCVRNRFGVCPRSSRFGHYDDRGSTRQQNHKSFCFFFSELLLRVSRVPERPVEFRETIVVPVVQPVFVTPVAADLWFHSSPGDTCSPSPCPFAGPSPPSPVLQIILQLYVIPFSSTADAPSSPRPIPLTNQG
jgi:hypothetical protein